MFGRRCDRTNRRKRSQHQRHEIHGALEASHVRKAGVKRHDQQKREKNMYAGDNDTQLALHLLEVAVEALQLGLVSGFAVHALRVRETPGRIASCLPASPSVKRRLRLLDRGELGYEPCIRSVEQEVSDMPPRGVKKQSKRERQYEHIKDSERRQGASLKRAEEIAARTVNKERARSGESKTRL